ncbi:DUF309 domain-containing protein [Heyndrickxia sporothermodurans]
MDYPNAYIQYLVHFHGDRDYFECHEQLEEYWKMVDKKNRSSIWVGLIQLAVSLYHYRRANTVGGIRLMEKALNNIINNQKKLKSLSIDYEDLTIKMNTLLTKMKKYEEYQSIDIKILDEELLYHCKKKCEITGFQWGNQDDINNEFIINRHMLRDRSEIEKERKASAISKKTNRDTRKLIRI